MALFMALMLLQAEACGAEAARHVEKAAARGEAFDVAAAADAYLTAAGLGCADADVPAHYLGGLAAAREAYRQGGSVESLAPVMQAVRLLQARAGGLPGRAQIAALVLRAAAAAAQSERDEMALLMEHAVRLEAIQIEAGEPALPVVSAHEAAADLWLQVHGYEEARRAYLQAADRIAVTRRVLLGLARVSARTSDTAAACGRYRELVRQWGATEPAPAEIVEAREYLSMRSCPPAAAERRMQSEAR